MGEDYEWYTGPALLDTRSYYLTLSSRYLSSLADFVRRRRSQPALDKQYSLSGLLCTKRESNSYWSTHVRRYDNQSWNHLCQISENRDLRARTPTLPHSFLLRNEELIDIDPLVKADMTKAHPILSQPIMGQEQKLGFHVLVCREEY